MTVRRDNGRLFNARQNAIIISGGRQGCQGRSVESLDDQPDAEQQFPKELRDSRDDLPPAPCLDDPEEHADPRSDDQGTADEPQHGHSPWNESGGVHQVAQDQPVPYADDEAGS